jgi:enterochelin esterase-like enzyme
MKHAPLLSLVLLCLTARTYAQDYTRFRETIQSLYAASATAGELDRVWQQLVDTNRIPLTDGDSVAFLYRGNAQSVSWMGDFNGWGYDKNFNNRGTRIGNSDIWILKTSFPRDARLDYKILVNETEWIIDPNNAHQQWSGVGGGSPNSELRMPDWKPDPITMKRDDVKSGKLERDLLMNSKVLGYQLTYSVYFPYGYQPGTTYKVVYVTDGYEYLHDRMGNMNIVLDNLIDQKKIEPIIAIFVDHREPVNRSNNRRMMELAMNEKYFRFFSEEFVPFIEGKYNVSKEASGRAILGTSMGGLTSAYFAFKQPGFFGMAGIQSPAFWFKPDIYTLCDNPENPTVRIFMATGVINDAQEGARKMRDILQRNTCQYQYLETNQGHSWGNWRDTIDDILVYFFPPKV